MDLDMRKQPFGDGVSDHNRVARHFHIFIEIFRQDTQWVLFSGYSGVPPQWLPLAVSLR